MTLYSFKTFRTNTHNDLKFSQKDLTLARDISLALFLGLLSPCHSPLIGLHTLVNQDSVGASLRFATTTASSLGSANNLLRSSSLNSEVLLFPLLVLLGRS
jgi:hypothetical protein